MVFSLVELRPRSVVLIGAGAALIWALLGCDGVSNEVSEAELQAERTSPDFTVYHAGPSLEGIAMTEATRHHVDQNADFPELGRQDNVTYLYGDCPAATGDGRTVEGGCLPPIEVQSSPLCEKHANLYEDRQTGSSPLAGVKVRGVPTASFDEGRILEVYAGNTTITVYGKDPARVLRFAAALRAAQPKDITTLGAPLHALSATTVAASPPPHDLPPPDMAVLAQTEPCA